MLHPTRWARSRCKSPSMHWQARSRAGGSRPQPPSAIRPTCSKLCASRKDDPMTPLWELRDVVKRYPGVTANDHVSLELMRGQIHGLLGENGCGKSTLIKILSGVEQPTSGAIFREGECIRLHSPMNARRAGIATVF